MKPHPRDFSPTIRCYCDPELVTRAQLAYVARIRGSAAMNRLYHGKRQPESCVLKAWAESLALPPAFRLACKAEIERRKAAMTPHLKITESINIDVNGDGRVDSKDFADVWHKKTNLAETRRHRAGRALADGRITDDELAEQDRLRHEEEICDLTGARVLRQLAHG